MSAPSPLIAAALADALSVPAGLAAFLSRVERELQEARTRLEALPRPALAAVDEVRAELDRALDDPERGALQRMLRRPLWQLDTSSPAVRAFGKYCRELLKRVEDSVHLQAAADEAAAALAELRGRYEASLPTLAPALLRAGSAAEDDLRRVRKPADVQVFLRRLERVAVRLAELAQDLPAGEPGGARASLPPDAPGVGELWVLLQRRLRERARALPRARGAPAAELETAREVDALARAVERRGGARRSSHLVAELLGDRAVTDTRAGSGAVELWTALTAAAAAAVHDPGSDRAWSPSVRPASRRTEATATAATLYVLPIGADWAYVTAEIPSAVRLFALSADVGKRVQARVFAADAGELPWELEEFDLAPLFSGIDPSVPAWYGTDRAARLVVHAEFGGGWFARVLERGRLRRLDVAAWDGDAGEPGAVRLLPPPARIDSPGGVEVGPLAQAGRALLWHRTRVVRAPFRDHPEAWLRYGDGTASADDALEHERALFSRLAVRSATLGMQYLGRARVNDGPAAGILYAPPFALLPDESPPLAEWIRERPLSFLRAIAEALVVAHDCGYALGICHLSMFAFSAGYGGRDVDLRPHALLCSAPYATPLGHYFPAVAGTLAAGPPFARLGFSGPFPWLTGAEVALPELDALAFAVLALELLPHREHGGGRNLSWTELAAMSEERADAYERPEIAARFAVALRDTSQAGAVLEVVRALAAGGRGKAEPAGDT